MCTTEPQQAGSNSDNPEAGHWIKLIANGNEDAEACMWAFWHFNHIYDDLVDKDKPVTIEQAGAALVAFAEMLSFNPFWEHWKWHLMPLYVSCVNRWLDGETWPDAKQAAVIRCGDVDFLLQFAYCTGGWNHLRACREARSYDKE